MSIANLLEALGETYEIAKHEETTLAKERMILIDSGVGSILSSVAPRRGKQEDVVDSTSGGICFSSQTILRRLYLEVAVWDKVCLEEPKQPKYHGLPYSTMPASGYKVK
jgi:hypothetical protein